MYTVCPGFRPSSAPIVNAPWGVRFEANWTLSTAPGHRSAPLPGSVQGSTGLSRWVTMSWGTTKPAAAAGPRLEGVKSHSASRTLPARVTAVSKSSGSAKK